MQQRLKRGPQLVHWVARCADIGAARAAMMEAGVADFNVPHRNFTDPVTALTSISLKISFSYEN